MPPISTPTISAPKITENSGTVTAKAGLSRENGSSETTTSARLATANRTIATRQGQQKYPGEEFAHTETPLRRFGGGQRRGRFNRSRISLPVLK